MEFEGLRRGAPSINLTALIDVVFILVVFLVLVARFQPVRDLEVALPSAKTTGELPPEAVTVTIRASGQLQIGGRTLDDGALAAELARARRDHENLVILADGAVAFARAVTVLGEASTAGFRAVSVAAREPTP